MTDGTIIAASAMAALQRQLDLTAKNLANLKTPGFQPRVASAKSFENALDDSEQKLVRNEESISFEQGTIVLDKGNPLAVAIEGEGFFAVETPEGLAYTRSGDFTLASDGTLVTRGGYAVQGDGGAIRSTEGAGPVAIDAGGAVKQGETEIGRLRLWEFSNRRALAPVSDTLYRAGNGAAAGAVAEVQLKPEALEYAGETSVTSLVDMIKIHRQYDAAQRVMQSISDTYQQRIRSLS